MLNEKDAKDLNAPSLILAAAVFEALADVIEEIDSKKELEVHLASAFDAFVTTIDRENLSITKMMQLNLLAIALSDQCDINRMLSSADKSKPLFKVKSKGDLMPRHKQTDRPVNKKLSLRESIVSQVDAGLVDPLTKQPEFGSWSEVVEALLEGWLNGQFKIHREPYRSNLGEFL